MNWIESPAGPSRPEPTWETWVAKNVGAVITILDGMYVVTRWLPLSHYTHQAHTLAEAKTWAEAELMEALLAIP